MDAPWLSRLAAGWGMVLHGGLLEIGVKHKLYMEVLRNQTP